MKQTLLFVLLAGGLAAQSVESIPFRAVLRPENEVPAVTGLDASGAATVWLHIVRDAQGRIVSGSADFVVNYRFPGAVSLTGLHIHRGVAGINGPVTIDSSLRGPIEDTSGRAGATFQGQIAPDNQAALATATDMLSNPAGFYVNLHTTAYPGGAIRGQLERAQTRVFLSQMSPANEVPAIEGLNARGTGAFSLIYTTTPDGTLTSAAASFDVAYTGFPEGTRFTGLHIHRGAAGANGPVTIDSGIMGSNPVAANANGAGTLSYTVEVPMTAAAVNTVYDILTNPDAFYLNLHTQANPGGAIRAQTRSTDRAVYQQSLSPANEVPPVMGSNAFGESRIAVWSIRNSMSGAIQAALVAFDINHRLGGEHTITGLHIHNGAAGVNGPVTIDTGVGRPSLATATGFGNIYRTVVVDSSAGLATLNTMLTAPQDAYVNLHTQSNPGGLIRGQVGTAATGAPAIDAVISAVSDPAYRVTAPGGLISIYGTNLTRTASMGGGYDPADAPGMLNGTSVIVANRAAAVISVDPSVVVAQVPTDTPTGMQPLYVIAPSGASNAMANSNTVMVNVQNFAPGIFFDAILPGGGYRAIAFKASNLSYVLENNAATAGDDLLIPAIGLGPVAPPLSTGQMGNRGGTVAPVEVTIGGRLAERTSASAVPMMVGLYWITARVPTALQPGILSLEVRVGGVASNSTVIPIR